MSGRMRERLWRWARRTGMILAVLTVLAAIPVVFVETACVSRQAPRMAVSQPILPPADRREEVNSYLTYPEWSIVYAYEDLAAVMRRSSESDYDYFGTIGRYWSSLCGITRLASSRGTISTNYKVMLHVIGLSFAAEMGVKGAYEKTIGRVTAFIRGATRTPEDDFALAVADDYAKFLRQVPWYQYPFGTKLVQFWTTTPVFAGNVVRKLERRVALSAEWGFKAVYAKLLGLGVDQGNVPRRIRSVIKGLEQSDIASEPRITIIEQRPDGRTIIETDRYRTLTEILVGLADRGRDVVEIAGNTNILVTVLAQPGAAVTFDGARVLFEVPSDVVVGQRRVALDVGIGKLAALLRALRSGPVRLEHVYDY